MRPGSHKDKKLGDKDTGTVSQGQLSALSNFTRWDIRITAGKHHGCFYLPCDTCNSTRVMQHGEVLGNKSQILKKLL